MVDLKPPFCTDELLNCREFKRVYFVFDRSHILAPALYENTCQKLKVLEKFQAYHK